MKGVSAILAAVMLIVVVLALTGIVLTFSSSLLRSTQETVENRTAASIECAGASITIDEVFVTRGNVTGSPPGSARARVVNNGLKDDLTLVTGTFFNRTGGSFNGTDMPRADFDVGEVAVITFSPIEFKDCADFSQVIVTTNCGTSTDTFKKTPKCS